MVSRAFAEAIIGGVYQSAYSWLLSGGVGVPLRRMIISRPGSIEIMALPGVQTPVSGWNCVVRE